MTNNISKNFARGKIAVKLAFFILLCTVLAVSGRRGMSNVPNVKSTQAERGRSLNGYNGNKSSRNIQDFKQCMICGDAHIEPEENIINGDVVQPPNKYPWMVQLNFQSEGDASYCGGAILGNYHILSAAHCFTKKNCLAPGNSCVFKPNEMQVLLLSSDPRQLSRGPPVEEIYIHPDFTEILENDIAIVKLNKPIICNEFASPICLPPPDFSVPEESIFGLSGWGDSKDSNDEDKKLLESKLLRVDSERCSSISPDTSSIQCLIGVDGTSPCFGDSGGSLFIMKNKAFYTAGVVSMLTSLQCDTSQPVKFTDVSKYIEWIKEITGLDSAHPVELNGGMKMNAKRKIKMKETK